ncbi:MAG: hypothetical protein SWY16_05960 [Cyanobacteriota bacterium]|nr:hypothetical protein [Cyanobacteriota bacterium]
MTEVTQKSTTSQNGEQQNARLLFFGVSWCAIQAIAPDRSSIPLSNASGRQPRFSRVLRTDSLNRAIGRSGRQSSKFDGCSPSLPIPTDTINLYSQLPLAIEKTKLMMTTISLRLHLTALSTTALCGIHALTPLPGNALMDTGRCSFFTGEIEMVNVETIASRPDNSNDTGSNPPPGSSRR